MKKIFNKCISYNNQCWAIPTYKNIWRWTARHIFLVSKFADTLTKRRAFVSIRISKKKKKQMKETGPQRIKKNTPNMNFRLFTSCPYRLQKGKTSPLKMLGINKLLRLKKSELQSTDKVYAILMYWTLFLIFWTQ